MRIGVDLGGTKIEALALGAGGAERVRRRVPTPRDYDGTVEAVGALVEAVEHEAGGAGTVGVGIPGVVDRDGLVKNANSVWLNGRPFDRDLGARLGREVRVMNDANCFALSEATDGAAAGAEVVFGVILGTGVGGGVVVSGRPLVGPNRIAGEWGHTPLPWPRDAERPGPACYCGLRGCVEKWLSGPGLAADHERATGRAATPPEVVAAAEGGDADAQATLDRYAERLGRGLAVVVNVLDPDVIVLGGGMSNLPDLAARVPERLAPWVFSDTVRTRVVRNAHGDSSGVRGAAWLWPEGG
ncbi:ROK family protein [Rubrivirga sp. S365]|uniref:ROK family protein n=1 Tax=Rubrivirga litoralis TaxID=3075598 RepID=A0ABU3BV03_9BACT|nr:MULTISPECIES: ROK family protein [unclassified Rubrivirga]MDT0633122.1 ROK family protein [Rubrivirga sp. F394]MDT7855325.1 ROK family protein [Rubrivirga sp. S365]